MALNHTNSALHAMKAVRRQTPTVSRTTYPTAPTSHARVKSAILICRAGDGSTHAAAIAPDFPLVLKAAGKMPVGVVEVNGTVLYKEEFLGQQRSSHHGIHAEPKIAPPSVTSGSTRTAIMAGNWKLNPTSVDDAQKLAALMASCSRTLSLDKPKFDVEIAVFPPAPFLATVNEQIQGTSVKLGAQDIYPKDKGAFTGAVSVGMVKSVGCEYVLCGHSERRVVFGESDAEINEKVRAVLNAGLRPILCIGESKEEYEQGLVKEVCSDQLAGSLEGVHAEEMETIVIAYEPVWAIGTGLTATPAIAQSVHAYIRSVVAQMYSPAVAQAVRIQYGGSVTPESVDELMACPDVDGCLVGGASLVAEKFGRIVNYSPPSASTPRKLWAQEVVPCKNVLGESPVWSSSRQKLYWANSVGKELWEWDLKGRASRWALPSVIGCVALQAGGQLLLPLEDGICSFNPETGVSKILCDFEPGLNTRPNDGRVDREGNFVIGSYNNAHREDGLEIGGLYRLSGQDGELREILNYKHRCSNCIAFTADGGTVFFCDTPTRRIFAFDYSPSQGLSNRRLLYEMPSELAGGPDGAQADSEGCLWAALSGAGQVVRIAPDGTVDTIVELPVASPTSCTIGGPNMDTLYITTRGPDGGGLYAVQIPEGVKGNEEPEFGSVQGAAQGTSTLGGSKSNAGFCDNCGSPFARPSSKYCGDCGTPRPI